MLRYATAMLACALAAGAASAQCQPSWAAVPGRPQGNVQAMALHDFDGTGPEPARLIVASGSWPCLVWSFDGRAWRQLGELFSSAPDSLISHDADGTGPAAPELYAGGKFVRQQQTELEYLVRWNGSDWETVPGLPGRVRVLCTHDADGAGPGLAGLYAGVEVGSSTRTQHVMLRAEADWIEIGSVTSDKRLRLASFDEDGAGPGAPGLYCGGRFGDISGVRAAHLARWDGTVWTAVALGVRHLPPELGTAVTDLIVFDVDGAGPARPELAVCGLFSHAGTTPARNVAMWDGSRWMAAGEGGGWTYGVATVGPGVSGAGPQLIEGTGETSTTLNVRSWDGSAWSGLGEGISQRVKAVQEFDEDGPGPRRPRLYVGGEFDRVNGMGLETGRLASWGCVCPADLDGDGVVDFSDYLQFLAWFDGQDLRADLDEDGVVDFPDYLAFLNSFEAGC